MAIRAAEQVQGADVGHGRLARGRHGLRCEPDRRGRNLRLAPLRGAFLETAASFETVHTQLLEGATSSAIVAGAEDLVEKSFDASCA